MARSFRQTLADIDARFPDRRILARLRRAGINSVSRIATAAERSRSDTAAFYTWLLGQVGGPTAEASLLTILRGRRPSLWMQAATSLSCVGGPRVVPELIRLLHDCHAVRRNGCAYALGYIHSGGHALFVIQALVEVLQSADVPEVRGHAAESLGGVLRFRRGRVRTIAEQALIEHLADPSPEVRFWCAFALGQMRAKSAVPALRRLVHDRIVVPGWWRVGKEARDALKTIAGR